MIGSLDVSLVGSGCNNFGRCIDQVLVVTKFGNQVGDDPAWSGAGATKSEQVQSNATALRWQLGLDDVAELDRLAVRS
ncbi:MAG: hypothetical protein ACYCS7_08465 [Acidimicrobiales bacterium]